jgi:hypothetical protein
MRKLIAVPISSQEAVEFVLNFHRHNGRPASVKFAVAVSDGDRLVGVAIVAHPIARALDDGFTAEVVRCCVLDDSPKGTCSFLYARCWNAAKAMGFTKIVTYTLQTESGASLRGAGWKVIAELKARDPKDWMNRPGREWHGVVGQAKFRWEMT